MNCDEALRLIDAYHDGELDSMHSVEIERHLAACDNCAARLNKLRVLREAVEQTAFSAPRDLRASVLASLHTPPVENAKPRLGLTTGLALAAALVLGFFLAQVFPGNSSEKTLLAALTESHIRSLVGTHLVDVTSSDQHTVRPWFEGKIDFAPPVEDLSATGFPLVGGRLEFVSSRPVAALVYERRKHFINLFIWPGKTSEPITEKSPQRGYNLLHWAKDGMNYYAVSEISADDLRKFANAIDSSQ
jgi:anti-sigma factor RsiW